MNDKKNSIHPEDDAGYFHSLDCDDIWIEGPGDTTVRPIRPSLLDQAKAARAQIYGSTEPGNDRSKDGQ